MIADELYPLSKFDGSEIRCLGRKLWRWEICEQCKSGPSCSSKQCLTPQRLSRLSRYLEYYKKVARLYVPEFVNETEVALRNHQDLLDLVLAINQNPAKTRSEVTDHYFKARSETTGVPVLVEDQHRAVNLAVKLGWMINCSATERDPSTLERGTRASPWRSDISFGQFIEQSFPRTDHPSLSEKVTAECNGSIWSALAARKLRKKARLRFLPTDNLRDHLSLNHKAGTVEVFHNTAFIKESLTFSASAQNSWPHLPRQLALEVLDSIQMVLFPADKESQALLRSLISKEGFDPDCLRYESAAYRLPTETDTTFEYFGVRLMDLYEELENPQPRTWIEKWLERRSGARYVMLATLIGVMIAVLLGLMGLGVAIFQAWVAWQQWKHPIST